jgi:hypothetical protein
MSTRTAHGGERALAAGLHLIVLALLGLQIYVRRFPPTPTAIPEAGSPEARWWGLWPITYAPPGLFAFGAAAILLLIAWLWFREFTIHPADDQETQVRPTGQTARRLPLALPAAAVLLLAAFFAFPIVHTRWGDAYIIARTIAWPDEALRLTHSWQAPLDVWLHSLAWLLVQPYVEWQDAMPLYRWLSPLAGAVYLAALLQLCRDTRLAPPWLTFGLLASLGLIQLFFGYVENYSFAAAGVLVYLWLGLEAARGERPLWHAATALALTNATHPSTIVLAPSLLVLGWETVQAAGNKPSRQIVYQVIRQIAAPMAAGLALTLIIMETGGHGVVALLTIDRPGGGDGRWLVPLWETETKWEHYTMFSWLHLRDFLNEQLLVAPVALPSLVLLFLARIARRTTGPAPRDSRSDYRFLVTAWLFYLLFVWLWNPDYGGQRDWDLFSLVAIPQTLLLVHLLPRSFARPRYLAMAALPLIAVQAMHTAAWIYQNTLPWQWP